MVGKIALFLVGLLISPAILSGMANPVGWASVNAYGQNGTTGGWDGPVVTVNNMADLASYARSTGPLTIQVEGLITITPKGAYITVTSDKTILGITADAGISQGGFRVGSGQKNIIFRNLTISDTFVEGDWPGNTQDWDGIQLNGTCHHIWIDHITFLRQGDGALDIKNGASYITVSNSRFAENNKTMLIGSTDSDTNTDKYKITIHNNWFDETTQRHPRVRFGQVHLFNNYFFNMGGYGRRTGLSTSFGYGIGVGVAAQIYSEKNYFERVRHPVNFFDNINLPGHIIDVGSHFVESGAMVTRPEGINWNPVDHYNYSPIEAENVKATVLATSGAGRMPTSVTPDLWSAGQVSITCHPNPVSHFAYFIIELPHPGIVTINIRDITGRVVHEVINSFFVKGRHSVAFYRGNLASGIYFVTLVTENGSATQKIMLH